MNLHKQQAEFARLRDLAGGDVHRVELAIIVATKANGGLPPSTHDVAAILAGVR